MLVEQKFGNGWLLRLDYNVVAPHISFPQRFRAGPLPADTAIYYRVSGSVAGFWGEERSFTTPPQVGPDALPYRYSVCLWFQGIDCVCRVFWNKCTPSLFIVYEMAVDHHLSAGWASWATWDRRKTLWRRSSTW